MFRLFPLLFCTGAALLPAQAPYRYIIAGQGVTLSLEASLDGGGGTGATVDWRRDGNTVTATIRNTGRNPVRLGKLRMANGTGVPGDRALVMSGWQLPSLVQSTQGRKLVSKMLLQLWDPSTRKAVQFGFVTFDRANTEIEFENGRVSAYCDFEGYTLAPGASVESERLRIAVFDDPIEGLRQWGDAAAAIYKPRIWPKNPAGWVGWSWVDPFHLERYEDVVRRNAEAIRKRLPEADIDYIWISLGNLRDREPGNWFEWNTTLLPSGPQKLVADLRGMGYKLGLWAGVFWMSSRLTDRVNELREAFLLKDGKPMTVPHRELGAQYILDPTHPKSKAWFEKVFTTWREWGIRYYMLDFVYSVSGSTPGTYRGDGYHNKALIPGPQAFRDAMRVIRKATGDDTYLLVSTGPTFQTVGTVDAVRAGTDYGEGRPLDGPGKGFYPATFVINRSDYWTSHLRASSAWATHFFAHRKLFLSDSGNVFTIDKPVPLNDAQITATIFGLNGSPLMIGDDVSRMSEERLAMLRQQFPRLPEAGEPLDLFDSVDPDYPKIFRLPVKTGWDRWDLIAVFNYGAEPLTREVPANGVVWDFWNERYMGRAEGTYRVTVPAGSVKLLRIAPAREHPWILSTDIHIRQGQAELTDVAWDEAKRELRWTANRAGNVYVLVPKGLRLADPSGLWIAKDGGDQSLIVRVDAAAESRTLRFAPLP